MADAEIAAHVAQFDPVTSAEAVALVIEIAKLRLDGEGPDDDDEREPWVMENDYAYEKLLRAIGEARVIMGWQSGRPPLHTEPYLPRPE